MSKGKTCRCPICGRKRAGKVTGAREAARVGMGRDEIGGSWDFGPDRREERRLRRTRERRAWKNAIREAV